MYIIDMLVVNSDLVSDSPHQIQTSNFKKKKKKIQTSITQSSGVVHPSPRRSDSGEDRLLWVNVWWGTS
jgi:hypothetical protein